MKKNILPITILLASIILGGFYYATQLNKQASIERQQRIKLDTEEKERLAKKTAKEEEIKIRKDCAKGAKEKARDLLKLNTEINPYSSAINKNAIEKEMFLSEDFNRYYANCLEKNGLKKLN